MSLSDSLNSILTEDIPTAFSRFGRLLDAEWIHEALEETGTASVRRRKIPAELVVWLVIGMAMYRDQAISVVVKHLGLTLPSQRNKNGPAGGTSVVPGAIPAARYRVGAAPMEHIFKRTALTWAIAAAEKQPWKGLSLFGVDGTTLRVQDTDENREVFGLPPSSRGQAGYPQTRIVTLMALRSHLIAGVKGFMDYGLFYRLSHADAQSVTGLKHWLTRAKKNAAWKTLEVLGEGDELVELTFCHAARKRDPELPRTMVARAINYQVAGHDPQTLLLDAELYPALEVAALYHERWELEVGYDETRGCRTRDLGNHARIQPGQDGDPRRGRCRGCGADPRQLSAHAATRPRPVPRASMDQSARHHSEAHHRTSRDDEEPDSP